MGCNLEIEQKPTLNLMKEISDIVSKLVVNNQSHLLRRVNELDPEEQRKFYSALNEIDLKLIGNLYKKLVQGHTEDTEEPQQQPAIDSIQDKLDQEQLMQDNNALLNKYNGLGLTEISQGSVNVIILCGGQGSRLGFDKPKGMYNIQLQSQKSIFQIFCEKLIRLENLARKSSSSCKSGVLIHLYLMTSAATDKDTRDYFALKRNFGLKEEQVHFFMQDNLPAVDKEGKIVLSTKSELFLAPNGNGGLYVGLQKNRILEQMKANGAKYVHIVGVDNVLNKLADPVMVGYMTKNHFEVVSKYVDKINAKESVGVHILKNGKPSIIEYSEMSEELRNEKILETLKYKEGFIAAFMTTTSFLEKVAQSFSSSEDISQYHLAQKKIPFFDLKSGQKITPEKNNGYKFELFIFDIFPIASSFGLMEVIRDQEFAPVKNKPGDETDTPITAKNLTSKLHIKWLQQAGAIIKNPDSGEVCEISPLISYFGENLESFKGMEIALPYQTSDQI